MTDNTSTEQAEAEGARAEESQPSGQAESQPPRSEGSWENDPAFRRMKSRRDRREHELTRTVESLEDDVQFLKQQLEAANQQTTQLRRYMQEVDPDTADVFMLEGELARTQAELQALREAEQRRRQQELAEEQNRRYHIEMMELLGGDPDHPEYLEALATKNAFVIEQTRARLTRPQPAPVQEQVEEPMAKPATTPEQPVEESPATPPGQGDGENVVLPAGGGVPDPKDKLRQQFEQDKLNLRQGDYIGLVALKDKYIKLGLDLEF